jgi:hypothetical protein
VESPVREVMFNRSRVVDTGVQVLVLNWLPATPQPGLPGRAAQALPVQYCT